jgi:hypothetical protein
LLDKVKNRVPKEEIGKICTIKNVALGVIGVSSHTPRPPEKEAPSSFRSIVESWGNTWMRDNLKITGDIRWIAEAIADNTLIAITNGSYMRELYPHLNFRVHKRKRTTNGIIHGAHHGHLQLPR